MIKIAVCEDNLEDLEKLKKLLNNYLNNNPQYTIYIDYFYNPLDLLFQVDLNKTYDLYILDVYMHQMSGRKVAIELKKLNKPCEIIFITSSKSDAIFAYQIEALQYILKPVDKNSLYKTLDKFLSKNSLNNKNIIILKTTKGLYRFNTNEVVYSEPEKNNYQAIILSDNTRLVVRMTVSDLFKLLSNNPQIVRCGASLNINLRFIKSICPKSIVLFNDSKLLYPSKAYLKLKEDFLLLKNKYPI